MGESTGAGVEKGLRKRSPSDTEECMTKIDEFARFMAGLPADSARSVETVLDAIMATYADNAEYSAEELAELDRRIAEPKPEYASADEVAAIFGKQG